MSFDGTPTASEAITGYDVTRIEIIVPSQQINYRLTITYTSGATRVTEGKIVNTDFAAALGSFCQATPRKKFITWLASNGYESNITPV